MSKKHKKRKHKPQKTQAKDNSSNKTEKTTRREPVAVMENKKYRSTVEPVKQTISNTIAGRSYKVVSQPEKWDGVCPYIGQIGKCLATDTIYGAKLKFSEGEMFYVPFDNIEIVPLEGKTTKIVMAESFVDGNNFPNQNIVKGLYYKVVKKPSDWKTNCRFLNRTGKCVKIDDRGARLAFAGGDELAFPVECLEEVHSLDLNKPKDLNKEEINEDNVKLGDLFRVIKKPTKLSDAVAEELVGKIGKARWANYRVVCLKFSDNTGFNVEFEALERYKPIQLANPIIMPTKLNSTNIVIGREYKLVKLPPDWNGMVRLLDKMGEVKWASDASKGAMMKFIDGVNEVEKLIPFDCISDLPRPTEDELIDLIKKNPEKILRIIKGLRKITQLKPVSDFIDGCILPDVKQKLNESGSSVGHQTVGNSSEEMQNRILALIGPIDTAGAQENMNGGINPS